MTIRPRGTAQVAQVAHRRPAGAAALLAAVEATLVERQHLLVTRHRPTLQVRIDALTVELERYLDELARLVPPQGEQAASGQSA